MAPISLSRGWRSEDGAQLVEFALVLPLLLFVVLGIAEFGFIFQRYEVITNAAREGARVYVLPGYAIADCQARVRAYLTAGGVPNTVANPAITCTPRATVLAGVALNTREVRVSYTHTYMFLPGIGAWFGAAYTNLTLTGVAEMRTEPTGS